MSGHPVTIGNPEAIRTRLVWVKRKEVRHVELLTSPGSPDPLEDTVLLLSIKCSPDKRWKLSFGKQFS